MLASIVAALKLNPKTKPLEVTVTWKSLSSAAPPDADTIEVPDKLNWNPWNSVGLEYKIGKLVPS
jgi:hypothetical protein